MAKLKFSHKKTIFTFQGEELPPPKPGTYDPDAWTPPTHRMYVVTIQGDGYWQLEAGGVHVRDGDEGKATIKAAREIVEEHLEYVEKNL